jgi:hypothetical protein
MSRSILFRNLGPANRFQLRKAYAVVLRSTIVPGLTRSWCILGSEMTAVERVRAELLRYEHPILDFSVREHNGRIELVIECKIKGLNLHTYYLELHSRDFESTQFPWTLQRLIYDGMNDYIVEMFTHTPQSRD